MEGLFSIKSVDVLMAVIVTIVIFIYTRGVKYYKEEKSRDWITSWLFLVSIVSVVASIVVPITFRFYIYNDSHTNIIGQVGDFLTGTTAPFLNFASFLMLFITLRTQNNYTNQQRVDERFFRLLSILEKQKEGLLYKDQGKKYVGEECLETLFNNIVKIYDEEYNVHGNLDGFSHRYRNEILDNSNIESYYKMIEVIFIHLDRSNLGPEQVKDYLTILWADLNMYELTLIYFLIVSSGADPGGYLDKYRFTERIEAVISDSFPELDEFHAQASAAKEN